jgi:hypothetical protein
MRSRTFLNVSLGILALVAAYELGATKAGAQAGYNPVVAVDGAGAYVYTANGDVYRNNSNVPGLGSLTWSLVGNVFTGPPTPVQSTSFGALKARYR